MGNISPLLILYNLSHVGKTRPPYLSALVHEIYKDREMGSFAVRVLFNGKVQRVCQSPHSFPLCPFEEWTTLVKQFTPSKEACPTLYENYEFLVGTEAVKAVSDHSLSISNGNAWLLQTLAVTLTVLSGVIVCHIWRRVKARRKVVAQKRLLEVRTSM